MVSFDVASLFTKVPIQLALNIAKQRLQSHPELSQPINFSTTDLIKGLETCLNSTNFTFCGKHKKTSFWNSDSFSRFISSCTPSHGRRRKTRFGNLCSPSTFVEKMCRRHFCDHEEIKVCEFITHLNTIESSNQFTMEEE